MKAYIHKQYGSPDLLNLEDVEIPVPGDEEMLIKVHATTVNRTDCAMLRAKPFIMRFLTGVMKPSNPILGTDFAGEVEAVGKKVDAYRTGDRIFGFDDSGLSSHAQYLKISTQAGIAKIPETVNFQTAAASLEGMHYALNMFNKFAFQVGQKVLVNGASGAIGNAALQLGVYYGLEVSAVCNTGNVDLMKSLGATEVFDYEKEDFTQTDSRYDFILDAVGKSSFGKCKPILRPKGIYISSELGPYGQNLFYALFTPLTGGHKVIFPVPSRIKDSISLALKLLVDGKFHPVIDRVYSYHKVAEAFHFVESGHKTGNVVIDWSLAEQ